MWCLRFQTRACMRRILLSNKTSMMTMISIHTINERFTRLWLDYISIHIRLRYFTSKNVILYSFVVLNIVLQPSAIVLAKWLQQYHHLFFSMKFKIELQQIMIKPLERLFYYFNCTVIFKILALCTVYCFINYFLFFYLSDTTRMTLNECNSATSCKTFQAEKEVKIQNHSVRFGHLLIKDIFNISAVLFSMYCFCGYSLRSWYSVPLKYSSIRYVMCGDVFFLVNTDQTWKSPLLLLSYFSPPYLFSGEPLCCWYMNGVILSFWRTQCM